MSNVLTIVPEGWLEIPNANQLLTNFGDVVQAMSFLANKEWTMFEPVVESALPPNTTILEAYQLGDSFFVRLGSTL